MTPLAPILGCTTRPGGPIARPVPGVMQRPAPERSLPRPLRVLIVEDNPDGREMLRLLLELCGYEVLVAEDGVQGVERALGEHPDVAVVDIGLPRLDGYQVAERIRSRLGSSIFLIAQTSYGQPEDRCRALEAGFDVHLTKPVEPSELSRWLESAARRQGGAQGTFPGSR